MSLEGKSILVFAAGGAIAGEVASQAAGAGATVHLAGRTDDNLRQRAALINSEGGTVGELRVLDATQPEEVDAFTDVVASRHGVHGVFNGIGPRSADAAYATPAGDLPYEKFLLPLEIVVGSQFLTSRAAARQMASPGSIVLLTASLSGVALPMMAGITAACGAVEALTRALAAEYGAAGIRVNCVRGDAMPETRTIRETSALMARAMGQEPSDGNPQGPPTLLGRSVTVADTAAEVIHLLSDFSPGITAQVRDVTAGTVLA